MSDRAWRTAVGRGAWRGSGDRPPGAGDPGTGGPGNGGRGTTSRRAASWTFLPIGLPFLVLGLALGLGKGAGTPFFIIGLSFVTIGLAGGEHDGGKKGPGAPPPPD